MKITMLKGLPASGKSTWAKKYCDGNTIRVNKDDIRKMMGGDYSKGKETITLETRDSMIVSALKMGKDVIVDDTNFNPIHEERLRRIAKEYNAGFEVVEFNTPVEECIKRDSKRVDAVGRSVIVDMYNKYLKVEPPVVEYINGLPDAIIVDIDGTLAHMDGRSPYDYSMVHTDIVDTTVRMILNKFNTPFSRDVKILVVSGREDLCKDVTIKWLNDNSIYFSDIYMRRSLDNRQDSIVKKEIYDEHIKGKYNVLFVLDDRDQVVRMWREQGLKCLQVQEGNF